MPNYIKIYITSQIQNPHRISISMKYPQWKRLGETRLGMKGWKEQWEEGRRWGRRGGGVEHHSFLLQRRNWDGRKQEGRLLHPNNITHKISRSLLIHQIHQSCAKQEQTKENLHVTLTRRFTVTGDFGRPLTRENPRKRKFTTVLMEVYHWWVYDSARLIAVN